MQAAEEAPVEVETDYSLSYPLNATAIDFARHITIAGYTMLKLNTARGATIQIQENGTALITFDGHKALVSPQQWTTCELTDSNFGLYDTSNIVAQADIPSGEHYDTNREKSQIIGESPSQPRRPGRPRKATS